MGSCSGCRPRPRRRLGCRHWPTPTAVVALRAARGGWAGMPDEALNSATGVSRIIMATDSMTSGVSFPGESAAYRAARDRLLEQEVELRRSMESVAAARRRLPPGGFVPEDYVFDALGADGAPTTIRLSELFSPGKDSLVIYTMMFPRHRGDTRPGPTTGETARLPLAEGPCPSCT